MTYKISINKLCPYFCRIENYERKNLQKKFDEMAKRFKAEFNEIIENERDKMKGKRKAWKRMENRRFSAVLNKDNSLSNQRTISRVNVEASSASQCIGQKLPARSLFGR